MTPRVANWESPALIEGLRFGDAVEAARRLRAGPAGTGALRPRRRAHAPGLRARPGDRAGAAAIGREPGVRARDRGARRSTSCSRATRTSVVAPRQIGKTWVSEPGRWGNTLTRYDVTLEKAGAALDGRRTSGPEPAHEARRSGPGGRRGASPEHDAAMRALGGAARGARDAGLGAGRAARDTALLDWLHAVQLRQGRRELSFCSLLPAQLPDWPAGPLTLRQVWAFYPYENSLVTVEATGRQVRAALERSAGCVARPSRARPQLRHARRAPSTCSTSRARRAGGSRR